MLLAGNVPNKVLYLYNPDETSTTAFNYLDYDKYYTRLFGLYMVAFLTAVGMNVTVAGIKEDYEIQREAYLAANAEPEEDDSAAEAEAEAEPVAEEPADAAPAEEQFF